ncbi:MAG: hypothetical protein V3R96_08025 [Dehalococcoidales bacterium]
MRMTYLWLLQLVTGVLILVLIGISLILTHIPVILGFFGVDTAELISSGSVADRANPGIWAGLAVFLVAIILYHALSGLRNTLVELVPSVNKMRIITWIIIVSGIILLMGITYVPVILLSS